MGSNTLNIAIENAFNDSWGSTTDIRFDNVPFTPPTDSPWVSLEVWDGESIKASIGTDNQLRRTRGTVFINIYTVVGDGSKGARTYADQAKTTFRDLVVSGITFYEGSTKRLGEFTYSGGSSQWYQMSVAIPFLYDEYL